MEEETKPTEIIAKTGIFFSTMNDFPDLMCPPKFLPVKSTTLEKMERLEREAARAAATSAKYGRSAPTQ